MRAVDFEYAGQQLSDFGFMLCQFTTPSNPNVVSAGTKVTFQTVSTQNGRYHANTGITYEECLTGTYDICRDTCSGIAQEIPSDEYRALVRWLNRKQFLRFGFIDPTSGVIPFYCDGSFNIEKILIDGVLCGVRLQLKTNRPFCYGSLITEIKQISSSNGSITIENYSDETGYLYPDLTITCNSAGDLTLANDLANCTMIIRNCSLGEVITQTGASQIISSSLSTHMLYNDFNFGFFRLARTYETTTNTITVSLPCSLSISYYPIIKEIF